MPWKPEVFVENQWSANALVFATEKEAAEYAYDMYSRWTLTADHRAAEAPDAKVNAKWENYKLVMLDD